MHSEEWQASGYFMWSTWLTAAPISSCGQTLTFKRNLQQTHHGGTFELDHEAKWGHQRLAQLDYRQDGDHHFFKMQLNFETRLHRRIISTITLEEKHNISTTQQRERNFRKVSAPLMRPKQRTMKSPHFSTDKTGKEPDQKRHQISSGWKPTHLTSVFCFAAWLYYADSFCGC